MRKTNAQDFTYVKETYIDVRESIVTVRPKGEEW